MNEPRIRTVVIKASVVHTVTYFIAGLLALVLYDYAALYSETALNRLMRPTDHPLVTAGVLFQPIRGALFGFVFWLLRRIYLETRRGWLILWVVLVILGILTPFGPAPGSIEGIIFTTLPFSSHLAGQLEVYSQSLLLSLVTWIWIRKPEKTWLTVLLIALFVISLAMAVMGLVFG